MPEEPKNPQRASARQRSSRELEELKERTPKAPENLKSRRALEDPWRALDSPKRPRELGEPRRERRALESSRKPWAPQVSGDRPLPGGIGDPDLLQDRGDGTVW